VIRVNLLPHRAEKRAARKQQFLALAILLAIVAGVIWFLGFSVLNSYIRSQQATNEYLEKEITVLATQIEEISSLKEQTDALLARKRIIESLQANRAETVTLLDELLRHVPDGVRLVSLNQDGQKLDFSGESLSEARVSTLIRSLEESPLLEHATPIEIRATSASAGNAVFTVMIAKPKEETANGKPDAVPVKG
jgi:type IV pilus assembly protein PilN